MTATYIISVPHSFCPKTEDRQCDLAAEKACDSICSVLNNHKDIKCLITKSDVKRSVHDLNRESSRHTGFRKTLVEQFNDYKDKNTIVIDVHSFPDKYLDEAGDINFFKKGDEPFEIVLLSGPLDIYNGISISKTLYNVLKRNKIYTKIIDNIDVLDILNQSFEYNIPGILLEFNERFSSEINKQRLDQICNIVSKTIYTMSLENN